MPLKRGATKRATEPRLLERERETATREAAALASRLISVRDEERKRIARDLHDNVGQQVTALRLLLDVLAAGAHDEEVRRRVTQAHAIVEQLDAQLDFLTSELHPIVLDLGAISAIRQFVESWSMTFGIAAKFRCDGVEGVRLDPDTETHLFRLAQEALNNVAKHAAASRVVVRIDRTDAQIVFTISDDGRGFDTSERARAGSRHQGLGLISMRERAAIIGATFDIRSSPGKGATITIVLQTPSPTVATGDGSNARRTAPR